MRWLELARACEERDPQSVPKLRAALRDADATLPLKRAACTGLSRLGAVEAIGDLIAELSSPDASYRRQVATTIIQLAGGEKAAYDPSGTDADRARQQADWSAWWEKQKTTLVAQQEARECVQDLAKPEKSSLAAKNLRGMGKIAVPALIDGLKDERIHDRALQLLRDITGMSYSEPKEWSDWWEKNRSS
jgi:hypothetical protein